MSKKDKTVNSDTCPPKKNPDTPENPSSETDILKKELDTAKKTLEEISEQLLRTAAEYDNFRKRSARERESLWVDAKVGTVAALLPPLDNLERALTASDATVESLQQGVSMTLNQFFESLKSLGVEEIPTKEGFMPELHNAVMHVEDENLGEGEIIECFQKGYKIGEKIIRHSVVKVAN